MSINNYERLGRKKPSEFIMFDGNTTLYRLYKTTFNGGDLLRTCFHVLDSTGELTIKLERSSKVTTISVNNLRVARLLYA